MLRVSVLEDSLVVVKGIEFLGWQTSCFIGGVTVLRVLSVLQVLQVLCVNLSVLSSHRPACSIRKEKAASKWMMQRPFRTVSFRKEEGV